MSVSLSLVISGMADVVFKLITVGLPASLAGARVVLNLIKTYKCLMQKYKTRFKPIVLIDFRIMILITLTQHTKSSENID